LVIAEIVEEMRMEAALEVPDEVLRCGASTVFHRAEDRRHAIKALMVAPLGS
jgi:ornithine carbamoyltransferase